MLPQTYLSRSQRRLERRLKTLKGHGNRLIRWRVACFFAGLLSTALALDLFGPATAVLTTLVFLVLFVLLVRRHQRVRRQQRLCHHAVELKTSHLARLDRRWEDMPAVEKSLPLPDHPYEIDLDITGPTSLYRLLHTCLTHEGGERLRHWLLQGNASSDALRLRQERVAALRPFVAWRDRLHLELQEACARFRHPTDAEATWRSNTSVEVLEQTAVHRPAPALVVLALLSLLTGGLYLAGTALAWKVSWGLYALVYWQQRHQFSKLFGESHRLQYELHRFSAVFAQIERFRPGQRAPLADLLRPFQGEQAPTHRFRQLQRVVAGASLQGNPLLWAIFNALVPWDMFFAWRYEQLKPALKQELPAYLDALWELEALNALAHYAWSHPHQPFPRWVDEGFQGKALGHPLLPPTGRVINDFNLEAAPRGFLITGSNMAGKSTFLKTLGLNLVLAEAGSVVDAEVLALQRFRLLTCIRVSDSVSDGFSYFYAEVRRLKAILEAIESDGDRPVFYLVDEIFKGTNNRERLLGSQAYLKALVASAACGGVSTHDLELSQLADAHPGWENYHFREFVEAGKMIFDYQLREGPCPTTNALRIMALAGLPVPASADDPTGV